MERVISVQLSGKARAELGDEIVEFLPNKRFQLLAYLAYQGDWVSRDKLVFLFWPDEPNHTARQNLRQLLKHIRKFTWLTGLESDEHRLRWLVNTDVAVFTKALEKGQVEHAVQLYGGVLCADLENGEGDEFHHWLELERQTLHKLWLKAALKLADDFEAHEYFSQAARVFEKLHHSEPLAEDHIKRYLKNLALSEQQDKAREVFVEHEKLLKQEFNSEPETETIKLMQSIRQGEVTAKALTLTTTKTRAKPRHNLPTQATAFVGREAEQKKLVALLAGESCRLVTIVAPGGMGKTRLAIEAAKTQLENFDEVCFVSFAAVASPDLMVYAVADALELSFFGPRPPKEQLLEYLKNKNMLLVLDNLEQLLSGIDLVHDILRISPTIKILATSRERLQLQAEYIFDLEGLAVPNAKSDDVTDFDSLRLFAERAKHSRLDFVLEPHLQAVICICQLVGGMPLAIELAASWSRLLTPNEIVTELDSSLELLSNKSHDLPERHHNMLSVFEVSWQRLSEEEQTALRELSVFQGGFEKEAAQAIAEVDLTLLLSLLNKSFVWRDTSGRFSQHPLILQYIQQKASDCPEEKRDTEEKHGLYYAEWFSEKAPDLGTLKNNEILEAFEKEFPNIRTAWNWMLREKRVEEIPNFARFLSDFFTALLNGYEGTEMFRQATLILDAENPQHHLALGYALIQQVYCESMFGRGDVGLPIKMIEHALELLEPLKDYLGIMQGQFTLGIVIRARGEFVKSKELLTSALELAKRYGHSFEIGRIHSHLIITELQLDGFADLIEPRLKELRELGHPLAFGFALTMFGSYFVHHNRLEEGEKLLLESLELLHKLQDKSFIAFTLNDLAKLAYKRGDFEAAETLAKEVYERTSKLTMKYLNFPALAFRGRVKLAQGHLKEARQLMLESLNMAWAWSAETFYSVTYILVCLAEFSLSTGQVKQAVMWLTFLYHYPAMEQRDEALQLLEKAKAQLSPQEFAQAQKESKALTLETIVTGILEQSPQ